jgi:hypothetical protein
MHAPKPAILPCVQDDSGKWVRMYDPFLACSNETIPVAVRTAIGRIIDREGAMLGQPTCRPNIWRGFWMLIVVSYLPVRIMCRTTNVAPWLITWVYVAVGVIAIIGWRLGTRNRLSDAMKTIMLSISRCPSCAYSLEGLATNGDRITCPECGAQWRLVVQK